MRLEVTNTETGVFWIEENENHSWESLCRDAGLAGQLCQCDLECLLKHPDGTWYLLDECGRWAYLPTKYTVVEEK